MHDDELFDWLTLHFTPGLGPQRARSLIEALGTPRGILSADHLTLCGINGIGAELANQVRSGHGRAAAELEMARLRAHREVRILPYTDDGYPSNLRQLNDFPVLLWVRGEMAPEQPKIGLVGTRSPSVTGFRNATLLSGDLVRQGFSIVSGMALGIDSAAHTGALDEGGHTIAVLGNGVDIVYPSSNRRLYSRIADRGALLSELPLQSMATSGSFQRRNRLISGMSVGVVVVEAPEKSGALLTAMYAVRQRRPLMAVPGDITRTQCAGSNRLLREGGIAVSSGQEIRDVVDKRDDLPLRGEIPPTVPKKVREADSELTKYLEDLLPTASLSAELPTAPLNVDAEEARILAFLRPHEVQFDELVETSGVQPSRLLSILTELEMRGEIVQLPGKVFALR